MNEPQIAPEIPSNGAPVAGAPQQPPATVPAGNNGGATITLTAEQLKAERDNAAAATRREIEADQARKATDAENKRKQDEQIAKGNFDQALATVTTERDAVKAERDALAAVVQTLIKDRMDELPAELRSVVDTEAPLHKQLEQVAKLGKAATKLTQQTPAGNPKPPAGAPTNATDQEAARRGQASTYRAW
jgi:uncharacterized phage infection (PIP) family protein YhgE